MTLGLVGVGALLIVVALLSFGSSNFPVARQVVTAPMMSTAKLDEGGWVIRDRLTLDEDARKHLAAAEHSRRASRGDRFPNFRGWKRAKDVDGNPVFVRTRTVPVHLHLFRSASSDIPAPEAVADGGTLVRAREGSTFALSTRRNAIFGTTPPSGDAKPTSAHKTWVTEVALDEPTQEIQVGLAGTWLRSPLGAKANDLASWSLCPLAISLLFLALVPWARKRTWGMLRSYWERMQSRRDDHVPGVEAGV